MMFSDWSSNNLLMNKASLAANLGAGANPQYAYMDFLNDFPQFADKINLNSGASPTGISLSLLQKFIDMANASISFSKYAEVWSYCMGLYVAHFCSLYLSATLSADPLLLKTAESVGDVSVSYDVNSMADDLKNFGTFKATSYGQQLATFAKMVGAGGMTI